MPPEVRPQRPRDCKGGPLRAGEGGDEKREVKEGCKVTSKRFVAGGVRGG